MKNIHKNSIVALDAIGFDEPGEKVPPVLEKRPRLEEF